MRGTHYTPGTVAQLAVLKISNLAGCHGTDSQSLLGRSSRIAYDPSSRPARLGDKYEELVERKRGRKEGREEGGAHRSTGNDQIFLAQLVNRFEQRCTH